MLIFPHGKSPTMQGETVLGTSKIDPRFRITLVQPLPELLNAKVGDIVVFVQDEKGRIHIKSSSIRR